MRIGVTGHRGYVARRMINLGAIGIDADVTDAVDFDTAVIKTKPDVIVHLAGKSDVNWCQSNADTAGKVNWGGSVNVFDIAEMHKIPVVFISSDHVFSGVRWWEIGTYHERSQPSPKNIYGLTKMAAESAAYGYDNVKIVRTSYLFSRTRQDEDIRSMRVGISRSYPTYMTRNFIHVQDFITLLLKYVDGFDSMPKVLHLAGKDNISWYQFMLEYMKFVGGGIKNMYPAKTAFEGGTLVAPRAYRLPLSNKLAMSLGFEIPSYAEGFKYES